MTDLDHLYALADGATAGPWTVTEDKCAACGGEWDIYQIPGGYHAKFGRQEDAAYIAALSPDVVKGLIERVKAAEQALALLPPADGWRSIEPLPAPPAAVGDE